jgi:hypothetical protein
MTKQIQKIQNNQKNLKKFIKSKIIKKIQKIQNNPESKKIKININIKLYLFTIFQSYFYSILFNPI